VECGGGFWTEGKLGELSCSAIPTPEPTEYPTAQPTTHPTAFPTATPTVAPTAFPTAFPTASPTVSPTAFPTAFPTGAPTAACIPGQLRGFGDCAEMYTSGQRTTGQYTLASGVGVFCDFSDADNIVTTVNVDAATSDTGSLTGHEGQCSGKYEDFSYGSSNITAIESLVALTFLSGSCWQDFTLHCKGSGSAHCWNHAKTAWAITDQDSGTSLTTSACVAADPVWRSDSGTVTSQALLPISQYWYGNTGTADKATRVVLAPLVCVRPAPTTPSSCHWCPAGTYSSGHNAATCESCANGQFAVAGSSTCDECPVGQFHASTGGSCQSCVVGQFNAWTGQTNCVHCPSGKYQDLSQYEVCNACPSGQWTAGDIGQTSCIVTPTPNPTAYPTAVPTVAPTAFPTAVPTVAPTAFPTAVPTTHPTAFPTATPTTHPTAFPTATPTAHPTSSPTTFPTPAPTKACAPGFLTLNTVNVHTAYPYSLATLAGWTGKAAHAGDATQGSSTDFGMISTHMGRSAMGFSRCTTGGELFSLASFPTGPMTVSVDFAGGAGGELGFASANQGSGGSVAWMLLSGNPQAHGTSVGSGVATMASDGEWNSYSATYDCPHTEGCIVVIQDYSGVAGACGDVWFRDIRVNAPDRCQCCSEGTFSSQENSGTCDVCANGRFSAECSSECQDCPIGQFHASTGGSCLSCEAGEYQEFAGINTACLHCPSGKFQHLSTSTACTNCAAGTWTAGNIRQTECVAVPTAFPTAVPTVSPTACPTAFPTATPTTHPTGFPTATPTVSPTAFPTATPTTQPTAFPTTTPTSAPTPACDSGTFRAPDLSCENCPAGRYSNAINNIDGVCQDCDNGKHSISGSSSCTECGPGTFHESTGASCKACEAGTFQAWTGGTNCPKCPSGQYQDQFAYGSCHNCPVGKWTRNKLGQPSCLTIPTASPTAFPTAFPTATPTVAPTPRCDCTAEWEVHEQCDNDLPDCPGDRTYYEDGMPTDAQCRRKFRIRQITSFDTCGDTGHSDGGDNCCEFLSGWASFAYDDGAMECDDNEDDEYSMRVEWLTCPVRPAPPTSFPTTFPTPPPTPHPTR
jgi:hypothetical protein